MPTELLGFFEPETCSSCYVCHIVEVFRHVRRVLSDDGTLWIIIGDSYGNDTKWGGSSSGKHATALHGNTGIGRGRRDTGVGPKNLLGVPWRVAFALQADGWTLRSEIIWAKINPMPESVRDRPTKAHETVFLFAKGPRYYFDQEAVKEPLAKANAQRTTETYNTAERYGAGNGGNGGLDGLAARMRSGEHSSRNLRSVWSISTKPYAGAHFATFPPDLVRPMILAGTSERGQCRACREPYVRVVSKSRRFESGSGRSGNPIVGKNGPAPTGWRRDA